MMQVLSCAVIAAGVTSILSDVRLIRIPQRARPSDLVIQIVRHGAWWQLDYSGKGVSFTTANELHVPAGVRLTLAWSGLPPPWIENIFCLPQTAGRCVFVAATPSIRDLRFVSVWPPEWRTLRIVIQSRDQFDRWASNEAQPARTPPAPDSLFRNAGCAYCHVIRGIADEPWRAAPDLTHFASRSTIATTNLPNRRGQLTGWIVHSRGLKAESEMPDNALAPDDLHAVVALLESLH
jgi:cytochrome c oxidase subunit II